MLFVEADFDSNLMMTSWIKTMKLFGHDTTPVMITEWGINAMEAFK
jgi:hypothetical protein